jgi:hypothetical protein
MISRRLDSMAIPMACLYSPWPSQRLNMRSTTSCSRVSISAGVSVSSYWSLRRSIYLSTHFAVNSGKTAGSDRNVRVCFRELSLERRRRKESLPMMVSTSPTLRTHRKDCWRRAQKSGNPQTRQGGNKLWKRLAQLDAVG